MTSEADAKDRRDSDRFAEKVHVRLHPIERWASRYYIGLLILIVVVGIAIAIRTSASLNRTNALANLLLTWGIGVVVVVASSTVGCFLGFLFGIPRSLQRAGGAQDTEQRTPDETRGTSASRSAAASKRAFLSNTSFEEISDWLTKIIIGLGLVQFQSLVAYLYKAALFAAAFVAAKDIAANTDVTTISYDSNFASPFYFALIIASLIAACLFTYLETRTRLTLLFATAEDAEQRRNEEDFKDAALRPVATPSGTGTGGLSTLRAPAQATPATERDETVASVPRQAIQNTNELIGWASAQARKGNLQIAEDAFRDALQRDPDNNDLRLRIADVRRLRHNYTGANELVNEVIDRTSDPTKNSALLQGALYTALYMPPPDGFRQAIALSNKLIEAGEVNDPTLWIWRAAAFGQKYKWLQQNSGTTEELAEARKLALEAITKAIQLSPQYDSAARLLLRALFDPDRERTPKDENDLQVFKGDPEFEQLIHWGKP